MVIQFPATGTDRTRLTGHLASFFLLNEIFDAALGPELNRVAVTASALAHQRPRGTLDTRVKHGHDVGGVAAVGSIRIGPRHDVGGVGEFSETDPHSLTPLADLIREPSRRHCIEPDCADLQPRLLTTVRAALWVPASSTGTASVGW